MKLLDVVVVKDIQVGESNDRHPCIVVGFREPDLVIVNPCSSSPGKYDPAKHLMFHDWHEDFRRAGFLRSTYAVEEPFVEIPVSDITKAIGHLEGEFARMFLDWTGLSHASPAADETPGPP